MTYQSMTEQQLKEILKQQTALYEKYCADGVKLDMARGKPSNEQLDLSEKLLTVLKTNQDCFENGTDSRNYGLLEGMPAARKLFGDLLGVDSEKIILFGSSSLTIMYDTVAKMLLFGNCDSERPWCQEKEIKFLCPVPGYDRHFAICQSFGIKMIPVPMNDDGPDMDIVKEYVNNDSSVKGIWCVPKYSNPTGIVYTDDVVKAFASLKPAAKDFRIFWDNAYAVHDFYENIKLLNIIDECEKAGNPNMPFMFASTSKITFPGAGIAVFASSKDNINYIKKLMSIQSICSDKVNQQRHVAFFKNADGILEHMKLHAKLLTPKFEAVINAFEKELSGLGIATWTKPKGGYFISFDSTVGVAKEIYDLCLKAGLTLTSVGDTFPYGKDPDNKNIRIAPSLPPVEQLEAALERFIVCVKIASINKILSQK